MYGQHLKWNCFKAAVAECKILLPRQITKLLLGQAGHQPKALVFDDPQIRLNIISSKTVGQSSKCGGVITSTAPTPVHLLPRMAGTYKTVFVCVCERGSDVCVKPLRCVFSGRRRKGGKPPCGLAFIFIPLLQAFQPLEVFFSFSNSPGTA